MKYFLKTICLISVVCLWLLLVLPSGAKASNTDNIFGWAWNPTIGWISLNSCQYSVGCGGGIQYGVNLSTEGSYSLSGFAWNDRVGWIQFDAGYPAAGQPSHSAQLDLVTRRFSGWVKIIALGNDGWIKLAKDTYDSGTDYWTRLLDDGKLAGWGWNNKIGWLSFNSIDWPSNTVTYYVTGQAPTVPTTTMVVPDEYDGCTALHIDWADSQYAASYLVHRSTSSVFTPTSSNLLNPPVNISEKNDTNLALGTDYYYHIGASNFFGINYTPSAIHGRTRSLCGITVISGQGDCLSGDPSTIALNWQAPIVAPGTQIDHYLIKRCQVSPTDNCLQTTSSFVDVSSGDCFLVEPDQFDNPPSTTPPIVPSQHCVDNNCHCWESFTGDEVAEQYVYRIVAVDDGGQSGDETAPAALINIYPCAKQKSWHWEEQNPASTTMN